VTAEKPPNPAPVRTSVGSERRIHTLGSRPWRFGLLVVAFPGEVRCQRAANRQHRPRGRCRQRCWPEGKDSSLVAEGFRACHGRKYQVEDHPAAGSHGQPAHHRALVSQGAMLTSGRPG